MNRSLTLQRAAHASPVAIAALVMANLVPLAGVLFLGWDLATLVAIYWAENGEVGIFAVGRIITAGNAGAMAFATTASAMPAPTATSALASIAPPPSERYGGARPLAPPQPTGPPQPPSPPGPQLPVLSLAVSKAFMVPFFCVHYGMFWFVHGVFVWTALPMLFAAASGGASGGPDPRVVFIASLFMFGSHGVSFVVNWLLGGEYRTSNAAAEMGAPYARVVILHLTIIVGAFAVALVGAPIGALVVMVVLKTGVDLAAHLGDRARAARRMAA